MDRTKELLSILEFHEKSTSAVSTLKITENNFTQVCGKVSSHLQGNEALVSKMEKL
jgi:hypothetical protein